MPWTIILENEKGGAIETLPESFAYEELDELHLPNFKLFHYVDPYGDTTFNCLQMDDLIADMELLRELSTQKPVIEQMILLLRKCKTQVHTYIKFYGD